MKCDLCDENFNDGFQCASCKKQLDFRCASISEASWRKLGADRTAAWKCPSCRITLPSPSAAEQASLLNEIRDLKRELSMSPSLKEDMHRIKEELEELRHCCDYIARRVKESAHKVKDHRIVRPSNHCSFFSAMWRGLTQSNYPISKYPD